MPWPIFHRWKTNSPAGCGGDKEKAQQQMAQEIGIRTYKRENGEKWRPSRLLPLQVGTATGRWSSDGGWRSRGHRHDNRAARNPHQVNTVSLCDVAGGEGGQRGASRPDGGGIRERGREEGRPKKMKVTRQYGDAKKGGGLVPVACWRGLERKYLPLSLNHWHTLYSHLLSPPPPLPLSLYLS